MSASYLDEARLATSIAAIATAPGAGAIGIVRISGTDALEIAARVFSRPEALARAASMTLVLGRVKSLADSPVDQVLAAVMRAPHTYTGEDTVEFQAHGGRVQVDEVLAAVLAAGALPALPGEFTLRAFLNGRMDLVQAESVADLIAAPTAAASRNALGAYGGELHSRLLDLSIRITSLRARFEAGIDFVDDDIPEMELKTIRPELDSLIGTAGELAASYKVGRLLRDGARVVICGPPNAGKSSLFNSILKINRSIVTDTPGTTRDAITEMVDLSGIPVILTDTAGLRASRDPIEAEGIRRARELVTSADLVLSVVDITTMAEEPDLPDDRLTVYNKLDLSNGSGPSRHQADRSTAMHVSALTGEGMAELCGKVAGRLGSSWLAAGESAVTRSRQHLALTSCTSSLENALRFIDEGEPLEVIALELREAARAIDELVGKVYDDEILERIFSEFCIGK